MSSYQIDYTSRDFSGLKNDLINLINYRTGKQWNPTDYSDLGNVLVEAFAYMGDVMSHYLDRVANETSVSTAIQRDTLLSFASLYGYKPSGPTPASCTIQFTNISSNTIDLPVGTQVMAPLNYGPFAQVYFETTQAAYGVIPGQVINLTAQEGKTVNTDRPDLIDPTYNKPLPISLGTSDGTANQNIPILDVGIIDNSLVVYVGQGVAFAPWSYVTSLAEYGPQDRVFTTILNSDGTVTVVFGDNINGAIPPASQLISATYKTSAGAAGNIISQVVSELTFVPGNTDPQVLSYFTVTNPSPAIGGADSDDTTALRSKITASITARKRAVTLADYSALALTVPQVGKASAAASVYSSVNLYLQTQNDSTTTPGLTVNAVSIASITATGTVVTVNTTTAHGFVAGQAVVLTGNVPTAYNFAGVLIASVPTTTSFTIASTVTGTLTTAGTATVTTPTAAWTTLSTAVTKYMADKIPIGTTLTILPPTYIPVYVSLTVTIGSAYSQAATKLAVYQAFLGANGVFTYSNNLFGDTIPLSTIISAAQNVTGVISVNVTQLNTDNSSTVSTISLAANQIPYLLSTNLVITATGGL